PDAGARAVPVRRGRPPRRRGHRRGGLERGAGDPGEVVGMAYGDFTLERVEKELGVFAQPADLFPTAPPVAVPAWLREALDRGMLLALLSEKARSEFIVAPVLLTARELSGNRVAIYS